jgi:simple sugar transport system substrate-binding protein
MVTAFEAAVRAKVDGIAVSLIDENEFNRPVEEALKAGIPVFAYNSDVSPKSANKRLSYIGQNLFAAGYMLGYRLAASVAGGSIAAFAATPEKLNLKPRADGLAAAIADWNVNSTADRQVKLLPIFRSGPVLDGQVEAIRGALLKYPDVRGMAGLDGGTTQSLAEVMQERSLGNGPESIQAAGFDLLPRTLELLRMRRLIFTIDQQPYLQGFLTTMEMFLFLMSRGMAGAADINTGQEIVTSENVDLYLSNRTRYEGDYATSWTGDEIGPIRISKQNSDGDSQYPLGRERVLVLQPDSK